MSTPKVVLATCSHRETRLLAECYARTIIEKVDSLEFHAESLLATAVARSEYTRSVSILACEIGDTLRKQGARVYAARFETLVANEALEIFGDFWTTQHLREHESRDRSKARAPVCAEAISGFVGDLFAMGLITFHDFSACVTLLLFQAPTEVTIRCIYALFTHGASHHHAEFTAQFFYNCANALRQRCKETIGFITVEEQHLKILLYYIAHRSQDSTFPVVVRGDLSLTDALSESVCLPPIEKQPWTGKAGVWWVQREHATPSPVWTYSTASSASSSAPSTPERHVQREQYAKKPELQIYMPRPIRPIGIIYMH